MAMIRFRLVRLVGVMATLSLILLIYVATTNRLMDVRDRVVLRDLVQAAVDRGQSIKHSPGHVACQRPVLPLDGADVAHFFRAVDPLVCSTEQDWVTVVGSTATLLTEAVNRHGDITCSFQELLRGDDDDTVLEGPTVTGATSFTFTKSDLARATCEGADGVKWTSLLAGLREGVASSRPVAVPPDGMGVSVLMIGLDSLSHNTFMRTLPKTYKYLTEVLGADVLNGYNIVGDGTAQALIPMLTGKTELELPETRHRVQAHSQHVDVYPLIWRDFANAGYVTMYAEDQPQLGTFNYRLRGFKEPPTDHYARPFYLSLQKEIKWHPNYCMNARPRHQVFFDYLYNFMSMYRDRPVFGFGFHEELSHDDVNLVSVADDDFTALLQRMKTEGLLDNTLLAVYSDHGHRFQSIRSTQQGKQEERLPFVSFVVPEKIKNNYSAAYQNLKANIDRLVTPFDVHATLSDVLHYSGARLGQTTERSISLFSQIPDSRTCSDAFIEPHWCACLTWEPLAVTDERVRQAAKALTHYINSHTAPHRGLCKELALERITWAAILLPNAGLLSFKQNADMDGFVPRLDAPMAVTEEVYEVHIVTSPGEAQYEAALTYAVRQDTFSVRLSDISRTNKYGSTPRCILSIDEDLAKYCVCRAEGATTR